MKKKLTFFLIVAVGLLVFLFVYLRPFGSVVSHFLQETRVVVYSKLSFIGNFISEINRARTLTEENMSLKQERQNLLGNLAGLETLTEENIFLRELLGLEITRETRSLVVGVFNLESTPRGHYLLINKGHKDGVKKDDVVISSSGVLIGILDDISENYSRVITVTSLSFKTTIKIISKNISGIARGGMAEGIYLDFISEYDDVVEGDTVVTTGNDTFPPDLIVGQIVRVSSSNDGIFKSIKVKPAIEEINLSRAVVLSR